MFYSNYFYNMNNFIQYLAFVLPIIATLCVLSVIFITLYLRIRKKFPVNVNCWFCNIWTKVHYDNYNCFHCPKCLQYNGFNQDGDYNKSLPEQHDELLNQQVPFMRRHKEFKPSNGLCHICNNNQKLKIYQLANFVPLNEDAFDVEVEHFQKQLEKAYKLCDQCEKVVNNVITSQNKWIFGMKIHDLKTKGLSLLDLNKSSDQLSTKYKRSLFLYFLNVMLIIFASLILVFTFFKIRLPQENSNKQEHNYFTSFANPILDILNKTRIHFSDILGRFLIFNIIPFVDNFGNSSEIFGNILHSNVSHFYNYTNHIDITILKSFHLDRPDINLLCITGLFFQLVSLFFNKNTAYKNIKQTALWGGLLAITWNQHVDEFTAIIYLLQVISSACIIYSCFTCEKKTIKMHTKKVTNKNSRQSANTSHNDLSDHEDNLTNNLSISDYASIHNSTLKYNMSSNDTANSDCSFESIKSKYTFAEVPVRNTTVKGSNSPIARYEVDHIFGESARFSSPLPSSPLSFRELNSQIYADNKLYLPPESNLGFRRISNQNKTGSFISTRNVSSSVDNFFRFDLNESLDKLHLGNGNFIISKSRQVPIRVLKDNVPRPILSPPKLVFANHKASVAEDGFWKNFKGTNYYKNMNNISSSSSLSSGFASQCNEFSDVKCRPYIPQRKLLNNDDTEFYKEKFKMYRNNRSPLKQNVIGTIRLNNEEHCFRPIQSFLHSNLEKESIHSWNGFSSELSPRKNFSSSSSSLGETGFWNYS